jgi:hypothetical protein
MNIKYLYQQLLLKVGSSLKNYDYKKGNSTFYKQKVGNWGVINFQKGTKSDAENILFTINLGIASSRLLHFFSISYTNKSPSIWDCHWRKRLGNLIIGKDIWWSINSTTLVDDLSEEILNYLLYLGIPEIEKYLDDASLRDLWLLGNSPSLTEFQRLLFLSVLINELGPRELLEPTIEKLKRISSGKPTSSTVDIYITKILENKVT